MTQPRPHGRLLGVVLVGILGLAVRGDEPDRSRAEAEAVGQAAEADRLFKAGEFAAALPLYEAERASAAALGDLRYQAYAARAAGCCHERLGDLEAAISAWQAAQVLDARRDDRGFEGYDWFLIGKTELQLRRYGEGVATLNRALPLLGKAIDRDHEADARLVIAQGLIALEEFEAAPAHLQRALLLARSLDDARRQAAVLAQMGRVDLLRGEAGPAVEWLAEARDAYQSQGDDAEAAALDRLLGDAWRELERPDVAAARVEMASEAHERLDDRAALGDDLQFLAELRLEENDPGGARDLARRASRAFHEADVTDGEIDALVLLARAQSLADDWGAAASTLGEALVLVRRQAEPHEQVRLLILAADVESRARQEDRAAPLLDEAEKIARRADNGALLRMVAEARRR